MINRLLKTLNFMIVLYLCINISAAQTKGSLNSGNNTIQEISKLSLGYFEINSLNLNDSSQNVTITECKSFDFLNLAPDTFYEPNNLVNKYKCYYRNDTVFKLEVINDSLEKELFYFKYFSDFAIYIAYEVKDTEVWQYLGYFCNDYKLNEVFFIGFNNNDFRARGFEVEFNNGIISKSNISYEFISKEKSTLFKSIDKIIKLNKSLEPIFCWDFNIGKLFATRKFEIGNYQEVVYFTDRQNCIKIVDLDDCNLEDLQYISCEPVLIVPISNMIENDFDFCIWRNY